MNHGTTSQERAQATLHVCIDTSSIVAPPTPAAGILLQRAAHAAQENVVMLSPTLFGRKRGISPSFAVASLALLLILNIVSLLSTTNGDSSVRSTTTSSTVATDSTLSIRDVMREYQLSDQSFSPLSSSDHE